MQVYEYPLDTREAVEEMVNTFLFTRNEAVRNLLVKSIRGALKHEGITRLWCKHFKVYIKGDGIGWDSNDISLDGCCPQCGEQLIDSLLLYIYDADKRDESHVRGCRQGHVYKILCGQL